MTMLEATRTVVGGIDTHGEVHVAAALDELGAHLSTESFSADAAGYAELVRWLEAFGPVAKVGVEGTGSYGAGLNRFLARSGITVVEVDRQDRQDRRRAGKSDRPNMAFSGTGRVRALGTGGGRALPAPVLGAHAWSQRSAAPTSPGRPRTRRRARRPRGEERREMPQNGAGPSGAGVAIPVRLGCAAVKAVCSLPAPRTGGRLNASAPVGRARGREAV